MQLPPELIKSLDEATGFDKAAFQHVHDSGERVTSIRVNPSKLPGPGLHPSIGRSRVPWTDFGYYLDERPSFTFDPLFHSGTYYVQEASSMFVEQAIKQTTDLLRPLRVLDLCASPGGKSTHLQSLLSKDSLLVSNDVIRSRANILQDNIVKWGSSNVMVTNNDPEVLGRLENYFDVILVDAPCSGSGLFRRDPEAIGEWSLNNVQLCAQRQRRILADIWPALKNDGLLIYSTCSYSEEEDEDIVKWLQEEVTSAELLPLQLDPSWNITASSGGYRFWPDKVKGEGLFLACIRKTEPGGGYAPRPRNKLERINVKEMKLVERWMDATGFEVLKNKETVYAWPETIAPDFHWLLNELRVVYSGTLIGELARDKVIPAHALAMSGLLRKDVPSTELDNEQAIAYLRRGDLHVDKIDTGWQVVSYNEHPLGWINALPNRINNYYPKEFRILSAQ